MLSLRLYCVIIGSAIAATQTAFPAPQPPPVTSGLQVWLTARAPIATMAGGGVPAWVDQQNGHVFRNANATLPTFVPNAGGELPAVDFTRDSGFIGDFSSTAGATIRDATIFVVGRFAGYSHSSGSSSYWFSIASLTAGSEHTLGRDSAAAGPDALYHWRGQPAPEGYYGDNIVEDPQGGFNVYTAVFRGARSGGGVRAFINGIDGTLEGPLPSGYEASPTQTRIGLWTSNGSGLDGMIREVLIYNRILSTSEIRQVEEYLAAFTGIAPFSSRLLIERRDALLNISWPNIGVLQSANRVTGPWSIIDTNSPYVTSPSLPQRYFRLLFVVAGSIASDTARYIEYNVDTGEMYFIGEQAHGLDYYDANGNDFWWCYMNTSDFGNGLLEYLMNANPAKDTAKARAIANGWATYTSSTYSMLELSPLASQRTYVNRTSGQTDAYTSDYTTVNNANIFFILYRHGGNGHIYFAAGGQTLLNAAGFHPPGDGSAENDNGVRADVAFKTIIPLTAHQKRELLQRFPTVRPRYDDSSSAYYYVHPPGL